MALETNLNEKRKEKKEKKPYLRPVAWRPEPNRAGLLIPFPLSAWAAEPSRAAVLLRSSPQQHWPA
jgi:hypothetical protein